MKKTNRKELEGIFEKNAAVGASTATIYRGEVVNREAFGYSNSKAGTKVDIDTRFQAASISKTVNAVAILTLVNRGLISIEDPVNTHLSRWRLSGRYSKIITVKHLLSHSGGTTVHGFKGYGENEDLPTTLDVLNGNVNTNSSAVISKDPPGKIYKYSGGGTTVLQALVEDVCGTSYDEFVLNSVFNPLGMSQSGYSAPLNMTSFSCAHNSGGNPIRGKYRRHPEKAAAGLWTTPSDLAKLLIGLFHSLQGKNYTILPSELTSLMISPVIPKSGLGIFFLPNDRISHSGANYGFRSYFSFEMQSGNGAVAMSNSERGARTPAQLIASILLKKP